MDFLSKYKRQVAFRSFFAAIIPLILSLATAFIVFEFLGLEFEFSIILAAIVGLVSSLIFSYVLTESVTSPLKVLESIISYSSNSERNSQPLPVDSLRVGRELVTAQSLQIYDLASISKTPVSTSTNISAIESSETKPIFDNVPIPLIGASADGKITNINKSALEYLGKANTNLVGQNINDTLKLYFQEDETLDIWLNKTKQNAVTATKSWLCVRHELGEDSYKQFDLVAGFSSGSNSGTELMLAIFDSTEKYAQDDRDISFVALAVHELRTPLTIMRGYIEVFEDELGDKLTPELIDFMDKMHASSERLTAFVSNILNVARMEENQLSLKLKSEDWKEVLTSAISDLQLRASVHGIQLEVGIDDNIPAVGVDRISIHEVLNNLIDNAIKYSGDSKKILVTSKMNTEGVVETSVQDFGIGIPDAVMPQLFKKYHRSHRSSTQISGTGLGLYLCKALVSAHGGNIWVRSKEGEGSIFTFTVLPFDMLSKEQTTGEDGIIRGAHGWIKNHSLYRN